MLSFVRRSSIAILFLGVASAHGADDQRLCNDRSVFDESRISACDRAISSGKFAGASLEELYRSRAVRFDRNGDAERAYMDYAELQRMGAQDNAILYDFFLASLKAGHVETAAQLADHIIALDKNNSLAQLVGGVHSLKYEQYAVAQRYLSRSPQTPIADLTVALLFGWATYGAGNVQIAVNGIDKLAGPEWFAIFKNFHTGMLLELAGMERAAGDRLERAYRRDDTAVRVTDEYARWLSRNRDAFSASEVYMAFDRKIPRHQLIVLGMEETRAGKKLPPLINSAQQGAAEALYGIGGLLTHKGGPDLALIYLQLALYLNPDHSLALLSLVQPAWAWLLI